MPAAPPVRLTAMTDRHAEQVLAIYQAGMDEGDATFETVAPDWPRFSNGHLAEHRFVALGSGAAVRGSDAAVLGWVAASAMSDRAVYAGVIKHSVYVDPAARGLGIGRALLDALVSSSESAGIWTIQSGIFPENAASLAVHLAAGFRVVGRRERIGRHHGRWRDVLFIERRSSLI
ncbi:MAG: N-acetyltransferase family protein [Actinomycetota bacterium]|nr:N-acetyltransferase family protein [Actinomycetota bacterium]MDQ2955791.1 N-acetyltransferase family protein [Actinomycetota bacterium]